jgi:hypothetical protein
LIGVVEIDEDSQRIPALLDPGKGSLEKYCIRPSRIKLILNRAVPSFSQEE